MPRMLAMPGERPSRSDVRVNRRDILAAALAAQVPLVVGSETANATAAEGEMEPSGDPRQPRYRETAHVRTYYELSRF